MKKDLENKLKKIKLLILDVDGILTNGEIILDHDGNEIKIFNVQDGFGIVLLRQCGIKCAIITARYSKAVDARAKDLKIDKVYQDAKPKTIAYERLLKLMKLKDEEACFMGDDLTDLSVLKRVGLSVSVPNGVGEVKRLVDYVTSNEGGKGAVREMVELILKAQNKWKNIISAVS